MTLRRILHATAALPLPKLQHVVTSVKGFEKHILAVIMRNVQVNTEMKNVRLPSPHDQTLAHTSVTYICKNLLKNVSAMKTCKKKPV